MSPSSLNGTVNGALRMSANFSHGTLTRIDTTKLSTLMRRARTLGPLLQWPLSKEDFDTKLLEQYNQLAYGEIRQLVAGTGVGKTTVLPVRIVNATRKAGLMILPTNFMTVYNQEYVVKKVIELGFSDTNVVLLRTAHMKAPLKGPTIYYSSMNDFLAKFSVAPDMFTFMGIDFLCLDESHYQSPGYVVISRIAAASMLSNVKVFYASASVAKDLVMAGTKFYKKPIAMRPEMFPLNDPNLVPVGSPMNYAAISCRTLIFLATEAQVDAWYAYYDENDIPVYRHTEADSTSGFSAKMANFSQKHPVVLLSTNLLGISFTLMIDAVIVTGYKQIFRMDYSTMTAFFDVVPITESDRTQQVGRAQRFMPGVVYYNDIECSAELPVDDPTANIYVWLWLKIFRIQTKSESILIFDQLCPSGTDSLYSALLNSKIHPALMLAYLDDNGSLYKGWEIMRYAFNTPESIGITEESNSASVLNWTKQNTGPVTYVEHPSDFYSRANFPSELAVIPYVAWQHYIGSNDFNLGDFDNRSVISAVAPSEKPRTRKSILKNSAAAVSTSALRAGSSNRHLPSRAMSVATAKRYSPSVTHNFELPALPEFPVSASYTPTKVPPVVGMSVPSTYMLPAALPAVSSESDITQEIVRVNTWRQDVQTSRHEDHHSTSSESFDTVAINLKRVKPILYKHHKLYPMDPVLYDAYIENENPSTKDFSRVDDLMQVKKNFANLHSRDCTKREQQAKYFLASIRVHNVTLMRMLQLRAGKSAGKIVDTCYRIMNTDLGGTVYKVDRIASLLEAMEMESFFVGIDKRTQHADDSTVSRSSFTQYDLKMLQDQSIARFALSCMDKNVAKILQTYIHVLVPIIDSVGKHAGYGISIGSALLIPAHLVESVSMMHCLSEFGPCLRQSLVDDYTIFHLQEPAFLNVPLRLPIDNEECFVIWSDMKESIMRIAGPFTVLVNEVGTLLTRAFKFGMSGAAVVAYTDGALLGMYLGRYDEIDGIEYGHFASTDKYMSDLVNTA